MDKFWTTLVKVGSYSCVLVFQLAVFFCSDFVSLFRGENRKAAILGTMMYVEARSVQVYLD